MTHRLAVAVAAAVALFVAVAALASPPAGAAPRTGAGATSRVAASQASSLDPVVIVAGTSANQPLAEVFYAPMAERLRRDGFRPFIFGLPGGGLGDIADTSTALAAFVDSVRAQSGAARVDLVGHSQGGLVGRYFVKNLGGAAEVDSLVSLGTPHYGTALANLAAFFGLGDCLGVTACQQMARGSDFLNALNAGDDTIGAVSYTNIVTVFDEIVFPYRTGHLSNDGNNSNVTLQATCPLRVVGHLGLALDGAVYDGVRDALRHQSVRPGCFAI
jgi:triacylglycerol lipase